LYTHNEPLVSITAGRLPPTQEGAYWTEDSKKVTKSEEVAVYMKQLLEQRASYEVGQRETYDLFREEFCIWKHNIF